MFLEWKHLGEIKFTRKGGSFQISSAKLHKIIRTAKQILGNVLQIPHFFVSLPAVLYKFLKQKYYGTYFINRYWMSCRLLR
jgi:hypothetical protein